MQRHFIGKAINVYGICFNRTRYQIALKLFGTLIATIRGYRSTMNVRLQGLNHHFCTSRSMHKHSGNQCEHLPSCYHHDDQKNFLRMRVLISLLKTQESYCSKSILHTAIHFCTTIK